MYNSLLNQTVAARHQGVHSLTADSVMYQEGFFESFPLIKRAGNSLIATNLYCKKFGDFLTCSSLCCNMLPYLSKVIPRATNRVANYRYLPIIINVAFIHITYIQVRGPQ